MEIMVGLNTKPLLFAPSLEGLSMIGSNIDFGPKIYFGKQEFTSTACAERIYCMANTSNPNWAFPTFPINIPIAAHLPAII